MSQRGRTVRGHALQLEGQAAEPAGTGPFGRYYRLTHRSECGAASPTLPSTAARQRWHREVHKPEVRANAEVEREP
jgi:hypothetical protein